MAIRGCKETTFNTQSVLSVSKLVSVVARRSWKNDVKVMENHGKITEFDSGKVLGTLLLVSYRGPPGEPCKKQADAEVDMLVNT